MAAWTLNFNITFKSPGQLHSLAEIQPLFTLRNVNLPQIVPHFLKVICL